MRGRRAAIGAVAAIVLLAAGGAAVGWFRAGLPKGSRSDDACRVTAAGGIVGLDARTGEVRWTNIVPDGGVLRVANDAVHHRSVFHPEPTDRTIDATDGTVAACEAITDADPVTGRLPDPDRLEPSVQVGELTIVPWGSGLRATDETGDGIWGTTDMVAQSLLGDHLLVETGLDHDARRRGMALVDLRTGTVAWEQRGLLASAAPAREVVVVRDHGERRRVRALDVRTGTERWRATVPPADVGYEPRAWEAGDVVVLSLGERGRMVALDAATGEERWQATPGAPGRSRRNPSEGEVRSAASDDGRTVVVVVDAFRPQEYVD